MRGWFVSLLLALDAENGIYGSGQDMRPSYLETSSLQRRTAWMTGSDRLCSPSWTSSHLPIKESSLRYRGVVVGTRCLGQ